ncbi:conserved hypothetical protein [Neorhodopirellula lusitana]|uniref:Mucoidy inhibitor MuiA family protein n=1 Tax=Neorhodopirellula lusitana TaxID=445327 RepID=A0ABY1PZ41_9BACT|nr:mucoidy inhibitor MuiA family protein [Neorhodopirellula lusitana]SMP51748.1 conserved hypothetical protein [Neorhodopirellula lusitana]
MRGFRLAGYLPAFLFVGLIASTTSAQSPSTSEPTSVAGSHSPSADSDDNAATGEIAEVTLYRDSALVTREIQIKLDKGSREVVVQGLPEQLIPNSVFAEGTEAIAIRAVRVIQDPIDGSVRKEVQQLDAELASLSNDLKDLVHVQQLTQGHLSELGQLFTFTHKTVQDDLNRGVLDADTLKSMWSLVHDQREELSDRLHSVERKREEINEKIQQTNRERAKLTAGSPKTRYSARIFVDVAPPENADATDAQTSTTIRLSYSVQGCQWSPQYSIKGEVDSDQVALRYGAIIQQLSGEDWNGVQLTLSTASPSVSASGPTLTPLRVAAIPLHQASEEVRELLERANDPFGNDLSIQSNMSQANQQAIPSQSAGGAYLQNKLQSLRSKQRQVEYSAPGTKGRAAEQKRDVALNRIAGEMQEIELRASSTTARGLAADAEDEVASQTYPLEGVVSLQSRREQQLVEIVDTQFDGKLYHTATPLLSSFAYREVELKNHLKIGLLSGPASIYLDDRFVGTMTLPTTASGQRLTIGFGADGQVRTRRELVSKEESVQGGNKRLRSTYKLVVNNFKDREIRVRVLDRIPLSGQSQQTSVELGDTSAPLSDDALYLRMLRPLGILRWDLEVPESSHGSKAFEIVYTYSVEFDRSHVLSVPPATDKDLAELNTGDAFGGGMGGGLGQ